MTNFINETRELNIDDLATVSGGMPFYGTGCSVNQNAGIGRIVGALGGGVPWWPRHHARKNVLPIN